MGYTTYFNGYFDLNKKLDDDTYNLLNGLNNTRRMKRDIGKLAEYLKISKKDAIKKYGEAGEFYFDEHNMGQDASPDIVDYNKPPDCQPSLWCCWKPSDDRVSIEWDGAEKFYNYTEWIKYIIKAILKPRGYVLNGNVRWDGEATDDVGIISIMDNNVTEKNAVIFFLDEKDAERVQTLVDNYLNEPLKEIIDTNLDSKK